MTRFGFFLFNILVVTLLYGNVFLNGSKPASVSYTLHEFSGPYVAALLVMVILSTLRWFMSHDPDIAKEIVSWAHALWTVPIITLIALYLIGAVDAHFWQGLGKLTIPKI